MDAAIQALNGAVQYVVPELILIATVCVAFAIGPFLVSDRHGHSTGVRHRWGIIALIGIFSAAIAWQNGPTEAVTTGPFRIDELVWFTRLLSFSLGGVLVLVLWGQVEDRVSAECQACLLAILAGANLVAAANDLITLFLALELVSIPTYVLLYLPGKGTSSREATIKYFLLSAFSSALVLFGLSYLYGLAGTTSLPGVHEALKTAISSGSLPIVALAFTMLLAGLSFRITAVPFHFYAPDVFQGVAPSGAAMLSFIPKVVGFVALFRVVQALSILTAKNAALSSLEVTLVSGMAIITMFLGNLMALRQRNVARMMAYSSIAHAGYMLAGFAVIAQGAIVNGWSALLFYLAIYGIATIGVFGVLVAVGDSHKQAQTLDDFSGLSRAHPLTAMLLAIVLFGLTGLPPTAGFLGKLNLFLAAWSQGNVLGEILAVAIAMNAAISAWYYLRLIAVMFLHPSSHSGESKVQIPALVGSALCAVATLALFVAPQALWKVAESVGRLTS